MFLYGKWTSQMTFVPQEKFYKLSSKTIQGSEIQGIPVLFEVQLVNDSTIITGVISGDNLTLSVTHIGKIHIIKMGTPIYEF